MRRPSVDSDWVSQQLTGQRVLYAGVLGHLSVGGLHLLTDPQPAGGVVLFSFEAAVLIGFPAAMLLFLRWFEGVPPEPGEHWRLALWGAMGAGGAFLVAMLYILELVLEGLSVGDVTVLVLFAIDAGGLLGLLFGWQAVVNRRTARRAERAEIQAEISGQHEQSLAFLNRILRHHVLNGLNIILGAASDLRAVVPDRAIDRVEVVECRSREMADYVEEIRTVVSALSGEMDLRPVDLTAILDRELDTAQRQFPHADIQGQVPLGLSVVGAGLTGVVFENLLENAVTHSDRDAPSIRVHAVDEGPAVRVTVADDGRGIPDRLKEAYFQRGAHGEHSLGEGLGLYLAESVVSAAGGRIDIEDNEPRGTRVTVVLPKPPNRPPTADQGLTEWPPEMATK